MGITTSPRVLVVTADLGGNLAPTLAIGRRLRADGAEVHLLGHDVQEDAAREAGLGFTAYTRGRAYLPARQVHSGFTGVRELIRLICDDGVAADVAEVAARRQAEVLLIDVMLLSGVRAGCRSGVPTVGLVHSMPGFFTGRWARGPIGVAAGLRGLRPASVWRGMAGAVTPCLPDIAGGTSALGGPVVGPLVDGVPRHRSPSRRPRVLISLSTFPWPGMTSVAARILDAVAAMDVDAVFTTGPFVDPDQLTIPPTVEVHRWVDHGELMPDVDLMITHAGHGSAMCALAHDVPLLMLPLHPMCDQPAVAQAISASGAGITLSRRSRSSTIHSAADRLLAEPAFGAAAARLGVRIRACDAAGAVSDYVRTGVDTGRRAEPGRSSGV